MQQVSYTKNYANIPLFFLQKKQTEKNLNGCLNDNILIDFYCCRHRQFFLLDVGMYEYTYKLLLFDAWLHKQYNSSNTHKKRKMYTADRQTHKAKIFMVYQHFKCYTHTYIQQDL